MARDPRSSTTSPDGYVAAGVFLVGLATLMVGVAPSGSWRDVSEFQWAAAVLGVPHPPGSPIHMLLGRLATLLPLGSIAWRMNLLSCVAGAASLAVAYRLALELIEVVAPAANRAAARIAALLAPAMLLGSPIYRLHAATAEVYALQALAAGVLAWLLIRQALAPGARDVRPLAVVVFFAALCTGVHISFVFYLGGVLLWFATRERKWLGPRTVSVLGCAVVLGGAVFAYVPLRAAASPSLNWGDAVTLDRLRYHLTDQKDWEHRDDGRSEERTIGGAAGAAPAVAPPLIGARLASWAGARFASAAMWTRFLHGYLAGELGVVGELAALAGLVLLYLRWSAAAGALTVLIVAHLAFAIPVGKWANPTGYNPLYLLACVLACVPVGALLGLERASRSPARAIALAVLALVPSLTRLPAALRSGGGEDWRSDELARAMVRPLEQDSILLAAHLWPLFGYLREVEGYRTDVDVVFRNEIYETQRMRIDPERVPDVLLPPPARLLTRNDRIVRMGAFLELNRRSGRPIAWQSEVDDLFFAVRPDGLLFDYIGADAPQQDLVPSANGLESVDRWLASFEPGGARRAWLIDDDDFEEAVLPAARLAGWLAARQSCEEAQRWWDRVMAVLGARAPAIPWTSSLDGLMRECFRQRAAAAAAQPPVAGSATGSPSSASARVTEGE